MPRRREQQTWEPPQKPNSKYEKKSKHGLETMQQTTTQRNRGGASEGGTRRPWTSLEIKMDANCSGQFRLQRERRSAYRTQVGKGPQVEPLRKACPPPLPPNTPLKLLPLSDGLSWPFVFEGVLEGTGVAAPARGLFFLVMLQGRMKTRCSVSCSVGVSFVLVAVVAGGVSDGVIIDGAVSWHGGYLEPREVHRGT